MGRGTAPGADDRPRVRLDGAARRGTPRLRRRARSRAVRAEHAGRRRPGARRAGRGGRGWRLDAAVGRAPGRHRRGRHPARAARGHPVGPGRPRPGNQSGARPHRRLAPGHRRSRAGERGDRRRPARTAGRAGAAGGVAARPRCRRAGPVVGRQVVQHPGERHRRHRYAPGRDRRARPGDPAHTVPAARPDTGPGVHGRARRVGHRGRAGRRQPAWRPGRRPGPGDGLGRRGRLDHDQADRRPAHPDAPPAAYAASATGVGGGCAGTAPRAGRNDPAHRLRPDPGPDPAAGTA